ncbi:unnamed protein product [Somion occarium]|uniref:Kinesin motor domain-containing protein n=1 Tax=Somion occarium TaxID=3059160 RepID=A0ABP1DBU4_9APHY
MAKPTSTQRSALATPTEDSSEVGPSIPRLVRTNAGSDEGETNIQVVIRCRRRSEREIQENSPIIVTTHGAKAQDITIETATPVSSLGVITLPPTRTYPFDMVFGPEADQALIYHEVVNPMLNEVLAGYNCTLFAYGQTGTGKTYTMQGDLAPTPMGNPSSHAGMIPRISFVELYNEELRDLLAPDLYAPVGTVQPMALGSSKDGGNQGGLKLFDDSNKKGVFIQGLEETPVKDTADALALLTKGSHRRQIAATKFNDHSSRSHSVFSITVHTKETSAMGDDLLKVGKLNLVDLAGSENIGRSGAENQRAREAGMINQSLLTLGRVINALVDRSSHVPYRESKLTRLLQDSLGGRTKTCLIATISPARSNMEETLSTLDYALRAKSIRNKPEVNQRMSRNALLKEYIAEIERLKADVLAAREKNGIFFSEETWQQMTIEQELKETEMQETKKQVEIVENQLRNVREEFEQSIGLLMKRDGELRETKEKLMETESELVMKDGQLRAVKGALEEEVVVRQAYQETETVLDAVATELKQVAHQSVNDLGRVFGKLERKTSVFQANSKAVSTHSQTISSTARTASTQLDDFVKISKQHVQQLKSEAEQHKTKELETLANVSARINEQIEKIRDALKIIHSKDQVSDEALSSIQSTVQETQDGIKSSFTTWAEDLRQHTETTCKTAEESNAACVATVETAFKSLGSITHSLLQQAQGRIVTERKSLLEVKALAESTSKAEITRLKQQNALLIQLLESEKVKAERAKDELMKQFSSLLGNFTAERDRSLRETFSQMTKSNASAEEGMLIFSSQQGKAVDAVVASGRDWSAALEKSGVEVKKAQGSGQKAVDTLAATSREGLATTQKTVTTFTVTYSNNLKRQLDTSNASLHEAYDQMSRAKRARIDTTDSLATDAQSGYRFMQRAVASTSRNIDLTSSKIVSEATGLSNAMESYRNTGTNQLSTIRQTTQNLLENGTKEDTPTGTTPRKRSWTFTDEWELTNNREVILQDWRRRGTSSSKSDTFIAEHLPLPDGGLSEDEQDAMTESEAEDQGQDETIKIASPVSVAPASLASSRSSSSSEPSALELSTSSTSSRAPSVAGNAKPSRPPSRMRSGLPTKGTLTERSTNIVGLRGVKRPTRR